MPPSRAWACLAIGLALGALATWALPRDALDWQPARAFSEPWRLWTAAFVHLSPLHLQANLLGCAVVGAFGIAADLPRNASWAWFLAWPLAHAALALQPLLLPQQLRLLNYGGLSGVLHAGVAIAALYVAVRQSGRRRWLGVAVLAGLAAKLVLEQAWAGPTQALAGWDFRVAPLAHLTGSLAGLLCAALTIRASGTKNGKPP